jgi:hypothetical protein
MSLASENWFYFEAVFVSEVFVTAGFMVSQIDSSESIANLL